MVSAIFISQCFSFPSDHHRAVEKVKGPLTPVHLQNVLN